MSRTQQNIDANKTWQPSLFDDFEIDPTGFIDASEIPDAVIDRATIDQFEHEFDINAHTEFGDGINEYEARRRAFESEAVHTNWLAELNICLN